MRPLRPFARRALYAMLPLVALAPARGTAQRLAPIAAEQRCDGRSIGAIEFVGSRRPLLSRRLDPAARIANEAILVLQPATRVRLLRRFLLLQVGSRCDEQRRVESERILRAQPYISDVAIRVLPQTADAVLLRVETIDEYVLYVESWGWSGLPAGLELGTGSVGGTGKGLRLLTELGRGGEMGWGVRFKDPQFLGRPIILETAAASRPFVDKWNLSLDLPAYTNFQRLWGRASVGSNRAFYTLLDTAIRDVTVEYERRTAQINGGWRLGAVNAPWHLSAVVEREQAQRRRVLQIRDQGPVDISPPPQVATRYPIFDATRVGLGVSYRRLRYHAVRGLAALSAAEDVALGHDTYVAARQGIGALQRDPTDRVLSAGNSGAVGSDQALLRWTVSGSWSTARPGTPHGEAAITGRTALSLKRSESHLTLLSLGGERTRHARIPTQLTFRDDQTGLLGFRTVGFGGAGRFIVAVEERHRLPLTTRRAEVAFSALSQAGRLWAGDAPFGVSTPWHVGVGAAAMVAFPAGAKQMLRVEIGIPVNPPSGLQRRELRIFYSDRTGRF